MGIVGTTSLGAAPTAAAKTYSQIVLADAPVVFYKFEEASGTVLTDSSGNGHNGAYHGGVTLAQPGAVDGGKSAAFDGSTGYAQVTDFAGLHLPVFTVEFWAFPTAYANGAAFFKRNRNYTTSMDGSGRPDLNMPFNSDYNLSTVGGGYAFPLNAWSHLAWSFDGTTVVAYFNGAYVGQKAGFSAADIGAGDLFLASLDGSSGFFTGRLDAFAIYGSALSSARVLAHYLAAVGAAVAA